LKIWYIFVRGFGCDFISTHLVYYKAKTEKPIVVLKVYKTSLVILLNMGESMHFG